MNEAELVPGNTLTETVAGLLRELLEGTPAGEPTWITSGGPESAMYGSVAGLSAEQASRDLNGSTIAAQVEHLRWALQLVNDWFDGQAPTADWSESWLVSSVDPAAWDKLQADLRTAGAKVLENLETRQRWNEPMGTHGPLACYGHAAYHLGAIRQMRKQVL